ncbi:ABC transporter ATP-binding protein [Citrobacter koseri]|nr:ABC transporter ATP-binding protein [Citrobacter koseri]
MTIDQNQEILRTEGLSKFFPGVKALDNVDFSLRRGRNHGAARGKRGGKINAD